MRLYSVTNMSVPRETSCTLWVKTQAEAKAIKKEWSKNGDEVKVMQREVPTNKDDLTKWLNHHVNGRPNV